jgi:hypothetical protein
MHGSGSASIRMATPSPESTPQPFGLVWVLACACVFVPWVNPFAPPPSAYAVPWLVALWAGGGLLLIGSLTSIDRHALFDACMAGWLIAGLLNAAIGLAQYVGWTQNLPAGLSGWINTTAPGQAFGHLRQRNQLASLTSMALVSLAYFFWQRPRTGTARHLPLLLAMLILVLGNAATSSRIGLVQLLILGMTAGWVAWRSARRGLWPVIGLGLAVDVLGPCLLQALFMRAPGDPWPNCFALGAGHRLTQDHGCENRGVLWSNVTDLIAARPWTGWGWGELDHAHYISEYATQRFCDILDNAHNLPLQLAVELGLPLAMALLGLFFWWAWAQRPWQETHPRRLVAWAVLVIIGLHSLVEYPLWYGTFFTAALVCVVYLTSPVRRPVGHALSAGSGLGVLALAAYASFDYHRIAQIYWPLHQRSPAYAADPMAHAQKSILFKSQVDFARLSMTPVNAETANWVLAQAQATLHYSPEPSVIEKLLEAAWLLHRTDLYELHRQRYQRAFPRHYARWMQERLLQMTGTPQGAAKSPD